MKTLRATTTILLTVTSLEAIVVALRRDVAVALLAQVEKEEARLLVAGGESPVAAVRGTCRSKLLGQA